MKNANFRARQRLSHGLNRPKPNEKALERTESNAKLHQHVCAVTLDTTILQKFFL